MNQSLCTLQEARDWAKLVNEEGVGGGVPPENSGNDYKNDSSGIFVDSSWVDAGHQPQPGEDGGPAREWRIRFNRKTSSGDQYHTSIPPSLMAAKAQAAGGQPANNRSAVAQLKNEVDQYYENAG